MFRKNLWQLLLTLAVIIWAVAELMPLKDRPFDQYVKSQAKAYASEFASVIKQADERVASRQAPSLFVALKQIGKEQKLDLSRFFPQLQLEASLKNVERRNSILLDELLKRSKGRLQLGLDLKGGVAFTLEVADRSAAGASPRDSEQKLTKAIEIISARVNSLGVAEPIVRPVGNNRIEVQLPGVTTKDNPEIVTSLKKPARLDFRLVHPTLAPDTTSSSDSPPGYEPMLLEQEGRNGEIRTSELYVKRIPEMTGEALSDAYATMDEFGRFKILLRFTKDGAKRFADVTRGIAEENKRTGRLGQLAIILDGKLYSAPTVREEIPSGSAEITGSFTQREAVELANVLNNPLDLPLDIKEQYEVGPSLAQDAIDSGVKASIIGAALVAAFMITYYTGGGLIAVISVTVNVLGILGVLASLGATMSMPGIAGIVLTIGMAVDAHILIFERMREELASGKTLTAAFHAGHEKAFTTIVDANLTTVITSGLMIAFGTGPVKGFGITLTIGIFSTMFTALIVSRMLLEMSISSGLMKRFVMMSFLKPPKMDFVSWGKRAFITSWLIVLVGVIGVGIKGRAIYGIDFAGGDDVMLTFKQRIDPGQLRTALEQARVGEANPLYQSDLSGGHEVLKVQTATGRGEAAVAALTKAYPQAQFTVGGASTIGPAIGKEIQWNAFLMIGLSIIGIMLYVAFRFEMGYGIGAVVSTIHDVLMTIGVFVLSGRQFNASMVGAILLIVGYSINDTIVVFDRIREELRTNPTANLRDIINLATNKVFNRSLLTSLTTFLAALALYLFGGGVINDLAFTFLVGIITGTFSSIYIASPIFYWWHKGDRKHVEAHHDIAPKYEWTGTSRASQ
jgi:SecD/SecF fusion protein